MHRIPVIVSATVGVFVLGLVGLHGAGSNALEEAAIRKVIAADNRGDQAPQMLDRIFWSGAYQRPSIGTERPTPAATSTMPLADRAVTKAVGTPVRIVVSDSHDLAYEYETVVVTITMKDGTRRTAEGAAIRVWQKEAGTWKVAVDFSAPYRQ